MFTADKRPETRATEKGVEKGFVIYLHHRNEASAFKTVGLFNNKANTRLNFSVFDNPRFLSSSRFNISEI